MEVLTLKEAKIFDLLQQAGTKVNDKFYYLPFWFEVKGDTLLMHRLDNQLRLPKEIEDAINDFGYNNKK